MEVACTFCPYVQINRLYMGVPHSRAVIAAVRDRSRRLGVERVVRHGSAHDRRRAHVLLTTIHVLRQVTVLRAAT